GIRSSGKLIKMVDHAQGWQALQRGRAGVVASATLARNGSQREPGARRQRERALGQGGAHGVAQGRLAGIVERGVEGAGGGTGGAGERLPVVVEVGVVDARLERAAGDALQAGAAEPLDEVALAHAGAWLLVGDARVD